MDSSETLSLVVRDKTNKKLLILFIKAQGKRRMLDKGLPNDRILHLE